MKCFVNVFLCFCVNKNILIAITWWLSLYILRDPFNEVTSFEANEWIMKEYF